MSREIPLRRSAKPSRPFYVLDEQIGFILRQVSQRHTMIFARDRGRSVRHRCVRVNLAMELDRSVWVNHRVRMNYTMRVNDPLMRVRTECGCGPDAVTVRMRMMR